MIDYWYGNDEPKRIFRQTCFDLMNIKFSPLGSEHIGSFKEECEKTAKVIADMYPNLKLGLTGGWVSQIILQSFLSIGFKPEVFTVVLPKKLNLFDTYFAKQVSDLYSLKLYAIPISENTLLSSLNFNKRTSNLKPWSTALETQIYDYYELLMLEAIQNLSDPVILGEQLNVRRDIHPKAKWSFILNECSSFWPIRRMQRNNSVIINNFFTFRSELLYSFLRDSTVENIISELGNGKLSLNSSRDTIFKRHDFSKYGRLPKTMGGSNIPRIMDLNNLYLQKELTFESRNFYFEIDKLLDHLENDTSAWKFI